ncbi:MAG: type IV pilin [archaeon]|nr:type IV pilin [archaeon]
MQKKGVSPIVAEVLLVLLTIAAVAVVATFVVNFVGPTLTKSTECASYKDYFSFKEEFEVGGEIFRYNCQKGNLVGASIKAGIKDDGKIIGFSLVFTDKEGITKVAVVNETTIPSCDEGGIKMLGESCSSPIKVPKEGNSYTYVYKNADKTFKTAEVYPMLSNGRLCDKSDSIELIGCGENIDLAG